MIDFSGVKRILWDFDGVIMDSMPIRDRGFEKVLAGYDQDAVGSLMQYHRENGGLSRYVKFRYFFEEILNQPVSDRQLDQLAREFTRIMREELPDKKYLITETVSFIRRHKDHFEMHVVSGSDQEELRYLCDKLGISSCFQSISGSPTPKISLVAQLLQAFESTDGTILIGDSKNDLEAAEKNRIAFYGFNNVKLRNSGHGYIERFDEVITSAT